jgi:hypothetical protein
MKLVSREYKFMLDQLRFADPDEAVDGFWTEMKQLVAVVKVCGTGEMKAAKRRTVSFLDTRDRSFRSNGYVLRSRGEGDSLEFTLKCRSPDRFIAAGAKIGVKKKLRAAGVAFKRKLEEDVATPFVSRFSHSGTLAFGKGARPTFAGTPETVDACASLFPVIGTFKVNGRRILPRTRVERVNGLEAYERVYEGGTLCFRLKGKRGESLEATAVVILWSLGENGRPLVAEFSFRYKNKAGNFNRGVAIAAKRCYELLQRADWALPGGTTKTAYAYGE